MNGGKKGCAIAAAVIELIVAFIFLLFGIFSIAGFSFIGELFAALGAGAEGGAVAGLGALIYGIPLIVIAALQVTGAALLIASGSKNTFKKGVYIAGAVITIIMTGFLSLSAILTYVSLAMKNETPVTVDQQ